MRLTRQSEIAIAILVACARRPKAYVQTSVAAIEAGASKVHTAKTVHLLVHTGLLSTLRGRQGGLALALPPEAISLSAVLRCTQPELVDGARHSSKDKGPATAQLDTILGTARSAFSALMARFTIADLVAEPVVGRLACLDCKLLNPTRRALSDAPPSSCQVRSQSHALQPSH